MTSSLLRKGRHWWTSALIALAAVTAIGTPCAAASATDWMDGSSQWAVGFVEDGPQSYCSILWNSETGRTVEFRQGLKTADWRLTDTAWSFGDNAPATIVLAGQARMLKINAVADSSTSLNISDHPSIVRAIVQNSIAGTVDLTLAVGDHGDEWNVPISRIFSMHSGVSKCLSRLKSHAASEKPPAEDEIQ